jgi:hypothetical protein
MRPRALFFALSILSPLAAFACSGDDTPTPKASDEDAGADTKPDATSNPATGSATRERSVDAGAAPEDAAPSLGDASTFCNARKAVLDRCGEDNGCKAAGLAQCEKASEVYTEAFKDAYVACASTLACDASIDDSCIKAQIGATPPTAAEAKFEADISKACGADAGRFPLGPYFKDALFTTADTTCPQEIKTDAGSDVCLAWGFFCAIGVIVDASPPDPCR